MDGHFIIETNHFDVIIHATGMGAWTSSIAYDFLAAERHEISMLGVAVDEVSILFDATDLAPLSEDVLHILRNPLNPFYKAKRASFVTSSNMGIDQIKVGAFPAHVRIFSSLTEAHWYLTERYTPTKILVCPVS